VKQGFLFGVGSVIRRSRNLAAHPSGKDDVGALQCGQQMLTPSWARERLSVVDSAGRGGWGTMVRPTLQQMLEGHPQGIAEKSTSTWALTRGSF